MLRAGISSKKRVKTLFLCIGSYTHGPYSCRTDFSNCRDFLMLVEIPGVPFDRFIFAPVIGTLLPIYIDKRDTI